MKMVYDMIHQTYENFQLPKNLIIIDLQYLYHNIKNKETFYSFTLDSYTIIYQLYRFLFSILFLFGMLCHYIIVCLFILFYFNTFIYIIILQFKNINFLF